MVTVTLQNVLQETNVGAARAILGEHETIISHRVHHYKEAPTIKNGMVSTINQDEDLRGFRITKLYDAQTIQVFSDKQERACLKCLGKGYIAAFFKNKRKTQETNM